VQTSIFFSAQHCTEVSVQAPSFSGVFCNNFLFFGIGKVRLANVFYINLLDLVSCIVFFFVLYFACAGARFIMVRNTGKVLPAEDDPGKGSQVENSSGGEKDDSATGKEEQATMGVWKRPAESKTKSGGKKTDNGGSWSHSKSKGSPGKGASRSDVMDLISDSISSFKTEIQGMIREALFPTQEGRSQDHVAFDLPEHAETEDLDGQDDSVAICGDPAPKRAWSKERAVTSEHNPSSFTLPWIALQLIKVMIILILIQTRGGREKGFLFLFTSSNFLRLTEHS
jgi:hypothetical protein